jgi:hypothetical protein
LRDVGVVERARQGRWYVIDPRRPGSRNHSRAS